MLLHLMKTTNNYFAKCKSFGEFKLELVKQPKTEKQFTIKTNMLVKAGTYILINGSDLNDGIYLVSSTNDDELTLIGDIKPEEFNGYLINVTPPKEFILLADEIKAFASNNPLSNLTSESIPNYSYSLATGKDGTQGWEIVFAPKLSKYNKLPIDFGKFIMGVVDYD